MTSQQDLERILEKAGYWAEPMHKALNYLEHFSELEQPKFSYNLVKHQALGILGHFRMFSTPEVYAFYKQHYERIIESGSRHSRLADGKSGI